MRVYEPNGARGEVTLRCGQLISTVERVNLLEEPADGDPVELIDSGVAVHFSVKPFEIVTLRIRM